MSAPRKIKWLLLVIALFICSVSAQESDSFEEDSPENTARVARISFIRGDVQIKRSGEQDWESATLNLPLVEGDEIATNNNARIEIQFDSQNFLRLAENSFLKITTLRDEGISVSLTEGVLSLRVFKFEKSSGFFEIDAPQTTISVQEAGLFRVDADSSNQIKVAVTENGQARVYSDSAGFTLRNGKGATIFLSNDRLGEWETNNAFGNYDEWDTWVAERDAKISLMLNGSNFSDRDVFGAEELNDYGSWSDSDEYGKVWRPHNTSISSYSNWSPYRYGNWRWVNPFGWTWVNDEPWGWATYHHGRWVNDNRGWFWTPYSYHRPKRNRWRPAIVFVFNVGNDVCWYPLSHRDRYDDYNRRYRQNNGRWDNNNRDFRRIPNNAIIAVRQDEFGRRRHNPRTIPNEYARRGLENNQNANFRLPQRDERRDDFRRDGRRPNLSEQNRVGVVQRQPGTQLDPQLRNDRFRRNRQSENNDNNDRNGRINRNGENQNQPNNRQNPNVVNPPNNNNSERRNNPPREKGEQRFPVIDSNPNVQNRNGNSDDNNRRQRNRDNENNNNSEQNNQRRRERDSENDNRNNNRRETPTDNRPVYVPRNEERREEPRREQPRVERRREEPRQEQPRVEPRREEPRVERRREEPRQEQPRVERRQEQPRQEQPRREERRQEQPRREEPRVERPREQPRQEQPKREEPRQRETPREERRSAPPPRSDNKREEIQVEKVDN